MAKLKSANFPKVLSPSHIIWTIHDEPPHQDLHCVQIQLFSSLVHKELINAYDSGILGSIQISKGKAVVMLYYLFPSFGYPQYIFGYP